jgi:hypothetical protein
MPVLYLMCMVFGAFAGLGLVVGLAEGSVSEFFVCIKAGAIVALVFGATAWILT